LIPARADEEGLGVFDVEVEGTHHRDGEAYCSELLKGRGTVGMEREREGRKKRRTSFEVSARS
jgi:hypothetical protein